MSKMDSLESLGRAVAEQQDALLAREELRGARPSLRTRSPRSRRPHAVLLAAAGVALVAGASIASRLAGPKPADALTFRFGSGAEPAVLGTWLSATDSKDASLRFSDGTTIVLDPGARARVVRVDRLGADLVLEGGRAHASFVPNRGGRWNLSVGPFGVAVTGTRFDVGWKPDEDLFELSLSQGKVSLSGCAFGESRPLQAGETARAWCRQNRFEIAKTSPRAEPPPAAPAVAPPPATAPSAAPDAEPRKEPPGSRATEHPAPPGPPAYRDLIRTGMYREAIATAAAGGFESTCAHAELGDLEALARAARLSGDAARAVTAYRALRQRFPRTQEAAIAAFYLGRIAFDARGDYADATRWFRTYLAEQPNGSLSREALGRLMEALQSSGDAASAKKTALQYLSSYPTGPHAELARTLSRNQP